MFFAFLEFSILLVDDVGFKVCSSLDFEGKHMRISKYSQATVKKFLIDIKFEIFLVV